MELCNQIVPILSRLAEGEAAPNDAMVAARHLSICTGCRIRLARERRLGELLERDLVDFPVDEGFVDRVMAQLPTEVPKNNRADKKRGLKLAGWYGLILFGGAGLAPEVPAVTAAGNGVSSGLAWASGSQGWVGLAQSLMQGSFALGQSLISGRVPGLPHGLHLADLAMIAALVSGLSAGIFAIGSTTMLTMIARFAGSKSLKRPLVCAPDEF